jgi:hypothetical protein
VAEVAVACPGREDQIVVLERDAFAVARVDEEPPATAGRSALAAAWPPKPPPTITMRGAESRMMPLDGNPTGCQLDDQPDDWKQERKRSRDPHDDARECLIVNG